MRVTWQVWVYTQPRVRLRIVAVNVMIRIVTAMIRFFCVMPYHVFWAMTDSGMSYRGVKCLLRIRFGTIRIRNGPVGRGGRLNNIIQIFDNNNYYAITIVLIDLVCFFVVGTKEAKSNQSRKQVAITEQEGSNNYSIMNTALLLLLVHTKIIETIRSICFIMTENEFTCLYIQPHAQSSVLCKYTSTTTFMNKRNRTSNY